MRASISTTKLTEHPKRMSHFDWGSHLDGKKRVAFLVKTKDGWCNVGEFADDYSARLFFNAMHEAIRVQLSGIDVLCKVTGMEVSDE